jgi:hypothetical protein
VRTVEDQTEPVPEIARAILSVLIEMLHTDLPSIEWTPG